MLMKLVVLLLIVQTTLTSSDQVPKQTKDQSILNVHIFPHSHMDLAWLHTFSFNYEQQAKLVLSSVIKSLTNNPNRTFVLSEVGFIQRFMEDQHITSDLKQQFKTIVNNGQIEMVNGGFAANDEATTYYEDIIDQMTYGHQYLYNHFDQCRVKTGWNIDSFGSSAVNSYILENMGIQQQFLSRINLQEKIERIKNSSLQIVMDTNSLEHLNGNHDSTNILERFIKRFRKNQRFTSFLESRSKNILVTMSSLHYSFQKSFCIDLVCKSSWRQKDQINQTNVQQQSEKFKVMMVNATSGYKNKNNIFLMIGDDFAYKQSEDTFQQIEFLMDYINNHTSEFGMNLFYSTPSKYYQELQKTNQGQGQQFQVQDYKEDDFFPYQDQNNQYWTGFYSSRPELKFRMRNAGRYLQTIRTLFSLEMISKQKGIEQELLDSVDQLERTVGLSQHHDAITGTSKQSVQADYKQYLYLGLNATQQNFLNLINTKTREIFGVDDSEIMIFNCDHNQNYYMTCDDVFDSLKESKRIFLNIYNPGTERVEIMKMKVPKSPIKLIDLRTNKPLKQDIICSILSQKSCEIYFEINMPQYSFNYVAVEYDDQKLEDVEVKSQRISTDQVKKIKYHKNNEKMDVLIVAVEEGIMTLTLEKNSKKTKLGIDYQQYLSGNNDGAYIQKVIGTGEQYLSFSHYKIYRGNLLTMIQLKDDKTMCLIKYYPNRHRMSYQKDLFEVNSLLIRPAMNSEIFLRFISDLDNQRKFKTDANGLSMVERQIDFHLYYQPKNEEHISQNIYPCTRMSQIEDTQARQQIMVVNDRSEGVTSLQTGSLDYLIQRSMNSDDGKGMDEGINERDTIFTTHYVLIGQNLEPQARKIQYYTDYFPLLNFGQISDKQGYLNYNPQNGLMAQQLEINGPIKMSFIIDQQNQQTYPSKYLVRLQNLDLEKKRIVKINGVQSIEEMALNGLQSMKQTVEEKNLNKWNNQQYIEQSQLEQDQAYIQLDNVLDIKTFLIH